MNEFILRPAVLATLLKRHESVVVLSAPAGMGKSVILGQIAAQLGVEVTTGRAPVGAQPGGIVIWDIPPYLQPVSLPEIFVSGAARLVVAKRPDVVLPGLERAIAYGTAYVADPKTLLISDEELIAVFGDPGYEDVRERTGGWPLVAFNADLCGDAPVSFLATEMLRPMPAAAVVDMKLLLEGRVIRPSDDYSLLPFDAGGVLSTPAIVPELSKALAVVIAERLGVPADAKAIAEAFADRGRPVEAILTFQRAGFFDSALRVFNNEHGDFFLYFHGPAAFEQVLAGFPRSFALQTEALVLSLALQSLKTGDVSRARRLLADRFGDLANDPEAVFSSRSVFSREFRAFRLLMLLYEDYLFSEELLQQCFALVAEFPLDDHLFRGSFYNSVLEFYIRHRRLSEAEDVAQRAMYHYECAGSPMLAFYISLHQALIRLLMGDVLGARRHAALSAKSLTEITFESPSDVRLQALLEACVEYEAGRAEPLARFLSLEIDDFSHGEIWPSLLELALHYGSQALGDHFSTIAARSFLDRWRVYQVSNRQFQIMIEIREASILQNANRWQEAAERLNAIDSRVDRNWVLGSGQALERMDSRDELALALAWVRQVVYEQPGREGLDDLIAGIMRNLNLTDRQRISLNVWLAYIAKRQRNLTRARAILQKTFEECARLGAIAPLSEERVLVVDRQ
jgi:hypothetical protein